MGKRFLQDGGYRGLVAFGICQPAVRCDSAITGNLYYTGVFN